ncbi:ATP-binding protein [Rhodoferax sp.]|uniref:ATP-binding protein n=1 Tax=Rhodoferax sp. TaxID=50421 RepID=UPI002631B278|nr:ATP-binding protein [Rhodoferax sp.]MDD2811286.1 ATP-binding protein [Rhodoferax sp.]MDD5478854.1 ATP-binding protein [Rhodoferax sp.]
MSEQLTLQCKATATELAQLLNQVTGLGLRQGWSAQAVAQVQLVVEELVVNIMNYGSQSGAETLIELTLVQEGQHLHLTLSDNGMAFDPLQVKAPDLSTDLDQRPVGGLGIYLVTQLVDELSYQRVGSWNRLQIRQTLFEHGA